MPTLEPCCDKMRYHWRHDDFEIWRVYEYGKATGKSRMLMFGRPDFANDGDGYIDDMTDQISIKYCPFCGTRLSELKATWFENQVDALA